MPLKIFTEKEFFGRNNELDVLHRLASEARAGVATGIFLSGKWGIGKTELLRRLFNYLFWHQNNAIPFFYTINTAFLSAKDFSRDYLCKFILQSLAFLKRDPSLINANFYSIEDLMHLAKESELKWAVDIMDDYLQVRERMEPVNLLRYTISTPRRSYLSTGTPVVVIIDDFHNTKKFYELNIENNENFWMLFEDSIKCRYTPHVLAGFQTELHEMFFYETSLGEHLELINLTSLDRNTSIKFFTSLCDAYALNIESELAGFIDLFQGNPFYIKSLVQAARLAGRTISADSFWMVYISEITRGKIYTYWTSWLKGYIPFDLRESSLRFLHHLYTNGTKTSLSNLSAVLSVSQEKLDDIIGLLQASGVIEEDFCALKLTDDNILIDVIRGLYQREILGEPLSKIKDVIIGDRRRLVEKVVIPFFDITIPSIPKAEFVAVKALEQVAQHYRIPQETIGQIQVALIKLFNSVFTLDESALESYHLKFKSGENTFSVEVTTPRKEVVLTGPDSEQLLKAIKSYVDDVRVERIMGGTRITLVKELRKDVVSTS